MRMLVFLTLCFPSLASAAPIVGVDGGLAVPLGGATDPEGFGGGVRLGLGWDLGAVEVVPEIGLASYGVWLPQAGGRVQFGEVTRPGAYLHALVPVGPELVLRPGWDAGVTLDVGRPRTLGWGLQLGAVTLSPERARQEVSFTAGMHLTLRL